ncbi:tRNA pseudouridine synthase B [Desulfitobacterium dichloroeliminans LMG P-21439]|uniref:tRNA pseudouridine synthase B n=1 Tax=Desulfitobacterium dichloroeliminans (strain LMG P-21439 / DCA1) TaxID=871963 RepID=L0FAN7_DESDL|nr:tRNA pseudouridine(55) synthase TruB [Desulfitobacterium dichloroeliminans]AGA69993.1 tRNA pseudouridine synthase B [Desulfitobacterium dichloroeliminans LMG P-21439]
MDGVSNVLKPVGMTSSDVVVRLRRILSTRKIGHTGTLDPDVMGVLPICVGKATRLAEYLTNQGKTYHCEITFGITTDTQDASGQKITIKPAKVSEEDFQRIISDFSGPIQQIPPMYSAVKYQGKRLYELARQGVEVERKSREIHIDRIELEEWTAGEFPKAVFEVDCSKGTYIRTLCHDIGIALGCGAHMSGLVRLRSGPFRIEDSISLEAIQACMEREDYSFLIPLPKALDLPRVSLPPQRAAAFRNGLSTAKNQVEEMTQDDEGMEVQVFSEGNFLGIGIWREQQLCPHKVF